MNGKHSKGLMGMRLAPEVQDWLRAQPGGPAAAVTRLYELATCQRQISNLYGTHDERQLPGCRDARGTKKRDEVLAVDLPKSRLPAFSPARSREDVLQTLRVWRQGESAKENIPSYWILSNITMEKIAEARPKTLGDLEDIRGLGPARIERYGETILALCE